jgi:hypothetical protein
MSAFENQIVELAKAICHLRPHNDLDAPKAIQELSDIGFKDVSTEFVQAVYNEFDKGISMCMEVSYTNN